MIITKDFVILNLPKTGSSFVRKVVKDIYDKRTLSLFSKLTGGKTKVSKEYEEILTEHPVIPDYKDQHGCYDMIPS